ncbi:MAG TPA: hypothetical protein VK211_28240, partial [Kamptonema sp.]|nr:hypothetical protein [Kamptonema sp.]
FLLPSSFFLLPSSFFLLPSSDIKVVGAIPVLVKSTAQFSIHGIDKQTQKFEFGKLIPTTNHKHQVNTTWITSECL